MQRKFNLKRGPRKAFIKGLAHNLIMKGKIKTTEPRAKAIRPVVEHFVTIAKKQNTAALRLLLSRLPKASANKIYYDIASRYKDRKGGYTRIVKQGTVRLRDAAKEAVIEFV